MGVEVEGSSRRRQPEAPPAARMGRVGCQSSEQFPPGDSGHKRAARPSAASNTVIEPEAGAAARVWRHGDQQRARAVSSRVADQHSRMRKLRFTETRGGDGFPQVGGMGCEAGMAGSASAICGEVDAEAEARCVRGENGGAAVDEGIVFRAGARAARKDGDMPRGEAAYA